MHQTHEKWLRDVDETSRLKQDNFLNHIASRLRRSRQTEMPRQPFRGAPEFWADFNLPQEDKEEMFSRHFTAAGGHVLRAGCMEEAGRMIAGKAAELGARLILRQDQPILAELNLESALPETEIIVWNRTGEAELLQTWTERTAEADIGIIQADYAVAYTGSIATLSGKQKGRSVSLLPTVLFALIPTSSLVTRLGEALINFDRAGREGLPAGIHFISGPSRSADIENDLTIGVHGPGIVFAVLVDDQS